MSRIEQARRENLAPRQQQLYDDIMRTRPEFGRDDERAVYDLVTELLASKKVSTATFQRAEAALGRD
ncbi:MAG TPA: hypothetical protein VF778_11360, partial [Xanthobacteraceae bacterium]